MPRGQFKRPINFKCGCYRYGPNVYLYQKKQFNKTLQKEVSYTIRRCKVHYKWWSSEYQRSRRVPLTNKRWKLIHGKRRYYNV